MEDKFFAKILLFGEYTILNGSSALAIPNQTYFGRWVKNEGPPENITSLLKILAYLEEMKFNFISLTRFREELKEGLNFKTNIPVGYGLGSSGAVSAAIFKKYKRNPQENEDLASLRTKLQKIENHFHGKSSGLDPLVSYLNKQILLSSDDEIFVHEDKIKLDKIKLFLIDTGKSRSTAPLVKLYKEKLKDQYFIKTIENQLLELVDVAIKAYLEKEESLLFKTVHEISNFQFRFFNEMILEEHRALWLSSLSSHHFKLKLCGAGGGGFILGFCDNKEATQKELQDIKEKITWIGV